MSIAALAGEAVGHAGGARHDHRLHEDPQQFGRPIGSFQALQHRAADMLVALEQARSMSYFAAISSEERNPTERRKIDGGGEGADRPLGALRRAASIQLHGGIAMTIEYACGHTSSG
jgi:alkylation response protein AidB-like acyl-CoA dehydrogenase